MINSRPSFVEIDLGALKSNIAVVKSWAGEGARIMAVVKADAYGHGAVKVSQTAQSEGVDFLGVAFLEEACELQNAGIRTPIVILYPEDDERSFEAVRRGFYITISDQIQLERIRRGESEKGHPIKFFVKVESGMNRYGMQADEVIAAVEEKGARPGEDLVGVTTNLADPLMRSARLAARQVDNFMQVMETIKQLSQNGLYYSMDSSGSIWKNRHADGTLVRVGHLLYGLVPGGVDSRELKPVMSVRSRIAEIHDLRPGDGVGYGFSYVASRQSRVATIPMGYADGYPWSLSNKGFVIVRGHRAPVVGRVCMDAFMVDVTDIPASQTGDEVVIMGRDSQERIDAHQLGRWAGSFSYEILSGWSKRLPRIYK
ncbi:MAG: alanine racemase [candidate division Zixibacteria bacterium RBG_16_53_22]|nr:MAG: alanine racemase [candidate division Zixibacteria bacterium RBG_16_53_22]